MYQKTRHNLNFCSSDIEKQLMKFTKDGAISILMAQKANESGNAATTGNQTKSATLAKVCFVFAVETHAIH